MKYLTIADNVAHAAADLLDAATHPLYPDSRVKEVIEALRKAPHTILEGEHK